MLLTVHAFCCKTLLKNCTFSLKNLPDSHKQNITDNLKKQKKVRARDILKFSHNIMLCPTTTQLKKIPLRETDAIYYSLLLQNPCYDRLIQYTTLSFF